MAIEIGPRFDQEDIYIDYAFEEVMLRWAHIEQKVYMRFYGKQEEQGPVDYTHRLFNEALLSGREVTRSDYEKGS